MSNDAYTVEWLGYNEKPNYNRVWGHIKMKDGRDYVFWGVKDKKMQFKRHNHNYRISFLINQNEKKGYKKIHPEHYELICPDFTENMEIWFMAYVLAEE